MAKPPIIVWFRQDLRLSDNPALNWAAERAPLLPVYVMDEAAPGIWRHGGAARWWLHHSLEALAASLRDRGLPLLLRSGPAAQVIPALAGETRAQAVVWNRCYEPYAITRDTALKEQLSGEGYAVKSFNAALLHEPWALQTGSGGPYKVYTPFWKALLGKGEPPEPLSPPGNLQAPADAPNSEELADWALTPTSPDWAGGLRATWTPGPDGARQRLNSFLNRAIDDYATGRDRPDIDGTSGLSPHLHHGEIGPREVWHAVRARMAEGDTDESSAMAFLSELGWRDFSYHLLYHFPDLPDRNFKKQFDAFPWAEDMPALQRWQRGETGYPIVDAGMRQLWQIGHMHNRLRMIVGSFLVKDLKLHWWHGERWFWDTLVDADLASNAAGWQWVAGCGADAAPFFRIFNPVRQSEKFDPEGTFIRSYVPEIAGLPTKHIHAPWEAPQFVLDKAGIRLGETYPRPMVDHKAAREAALKAFETIKQAA